jgi:sugar lactone lactonase YvrE
MHRSLVSFAAGVLTLAVSGCSQQAPSWQPPQNPASSAALHVTSGAAKSDVLYVPDIYGETVNSYTGSPRKLKNSINLGASGLAVDAAGHVYISIYRDNRVDIYTHQTKKLIRSIDRDIKEPSQVTVAPDGTLFVADRRGISIFPNAKQLRMKRINHIWPFSMVTDAQSNLYVVDGGLNSIFEYAAGTNTVSRTITQGLVSPVAAAFDSNGNMYVSNGLAPGQCGNDANGGSVTVYAPNGSIPAYTITTAQGLCYPGALSFDASGNLYVANWDDGKETGGTVTEYSAGTSSLIQTYADGIGHPNSVAIDAAGKLYVANSMESGYGDVTVYNTANAKLVQTISESSRIAPESVVIGK